MSDQLVHVRDPKNGEEGYVGAAWLDRWPDDFERLDDSSPTAPTAPAAEPAPAPAAAPEQEPSSTSNSTQF